MVWKIRAFFPLLLLFACGKQPGTRLDAGSGLINMSHLDHLCEEVVFQGDSVTLVHIYADYPGYDWTDASGEGTACLDDVARAAVVYMRNYEMTRNTDHLKRIRGLLGFVLRMQTDSGEFYNFVDRNLRINRHGKTSLLSFNFWAARGYWALGYGVRIFRNRDPVFADTLEKRFLLCKKPIRKILEKYGQYTYIDGHSYPVWLVNGSGADATSELLLGLAHYLEVHQDDELAEMALLLAEGLIKMQLEEDHPRGGAFLSWRGIWHAYANGQTQALSSLGRILNRPELISAAVREARLFYPRLIENGFLNMFSTGGKEEKRFPQIAYGIRPVAAGLIRLKQATGDREYGEMAGLAGAWFFGRNPAGTVMYDTETGRCFDGINSPGSINRNSGAESTIEALLCLTEIVSDSTAYRRMREWIEEHAEDRMQEMD
jgi:hypothetical protein